MCDICQAFTDMSAQCPWPSLRVQGKTHKEHVKHEGAYKTPKKKKSQGQKKMSQSHGPDATKQS